jgi:hypothetical protein
MHLSALASGVMIMHAFRSPPGPQGRDSSHRYLSRPTVLIDHAWASDGSTVTFRLAQIDPAWRLEFGGVQRVQNKPFLGLLPICRTSEPSVGPATNAPASGVRVAKARVALMHCAKRGMTRSSPAQRILGRNFDVCPRSPGRLARLAAAPFRQLAQRPGPPTSPPARWA